MNRYDRLHAPYCAMRNAQHCDMGARRPCGGGDPLKTEHIMSFRIEGEGYWTVSTCKPSLRHGEASIASSRCPEARQLLASASPFSSAVCLAVPEFVKIGGGGTGSWHNTQVTSTTGLTVGRAVAAQMALLV